MADARNPHGPDQDSAKATGTNPSLVDQLNKLTAKAIQKREDSFIFIPMARSNQQVAHNQTAESFLADIEDMRVPPSMITVPASVDLIEDKKEELSEKDTSLLQIKQPSTRKSRRRRKGKTEFVLGNQSSDGDDEKSFREENTESEYESDHKETRGSTTPETDADFQSTCSRSESICTDTSWIVRNMGLEESIDDSIYYDSASKLVFPIPNEQELEQEDTLKDSCDSDEENVLCLRDERKHKSISIPDRHFGGVDDPPKEDMGLVIAGMHVNQVKLAAAATVIIYGLLWMAGRATGWE